MPMVRIDVMDGKTAAYRRHIGEVVHTAMTTTIGVPKDDRFQVIAQHDPHDFIYDLTYLGIERSDDLVMIQITLNEGRTADQKRALYKAIADGLHEAIGLRRQDVLINLVEIRKENWSFGNGEAPYAG